MSPRRLSGKMNTFESRAIEGLGMSHLLRIVMIHGHLEGVIELSVDGHTNICQAVLTRKSEGGVEYRFVGAHYRGTGGVRRHRSEERTRAPAPGGCW